MQIGYLEQMSETLWDTEEFNHTLNSLPAVFGWDNLSHFEFREAPFPNEIGAYIKHMYLKDRKLHVFAVCGTKSFVDVLVDVELWASSAMVTIFRSFIPFLNEFDHLDREFLNGMLALPKGIFRALSMSEWYIQTITDYFKGVEVGEDEDVLLTGHSLGGGLAKAIALKTGLATVAWSGPGTSGLEGVFGGSHTRPNIVSVSPEQDWVAAIDPSDGTTFRLPCKSGFMNCHDLRRMLCQMAAMCGTVEQTKGKCLRWFDEKGLQEMWDLAHPTVTTPVQK
jgi:hypothetical protein